MTLSIFGVNESFAQNEGEESPPQSEVDVSLGEIVDGLQEFFEELTPWDWINSLGSGITGLDKDTIVGCTDIVTEEIPGLDEKGKNIDQVREASEDCKKLFNLFGGDDFRVGGSDDESDEDSEEESGSMSDDFMDWLRGWLNDVVSDEEEDPCPPVDSSGFMPPVLHMIGGIEVLAELYQVDPCPPLEEGTDDTEEWDDDPEGPEFTGSFPTVQVEAIDGCNEEYGYTLFVVYSVDRDSSHQHTAEYSPGGNIEGGDPGIDGSMAFSSYVYKNPSFNPIDVTVSVYTIEGLSNHPDDIAASVKHHPPIQHVVPRKCVNFIEEPNEISVGPFPPGKDSGNPPTIRIEGNDRCFMGVGVLDIYITVEDSDSKEGNTLTIFQPGSGLIEESNYQVTNAEPSTHEETIDEGSADIQKSYDNETERAIPVQVMVQAWDSEGNKSQKPMTFVVPTCLFDDLQDEIPPEKPGDDEEQDDLTGGGQDPVYHQFEMNILPVDDFVEYLNNSTKLYVEITLVSSDSAYDVNLHFYSHSNEVKWVDTQSPQSIDFVTNIPQTITAWFSCDDVTNDGSLEVELRDSADQWIMDKEVEVACVAPEDEEDEIEPFVPTFDRFFHGDDLTIKFVGLKDYDEKPVISRENWPFGGWEFEVEITNHEKSKRFRDFTFAISNPSFDDGIEALPRGIGPIRDMTFNPESTTSIRSVGWCYEEGDHVLSANVLSQADSSAKSEWIKITCVLPDSGTDDPPPIDDGDEQQPKSPKIGMSMSSEEPIQSVGVSWPVDFTVSYTGEQSQNYDLFYFSDDYLVVTPIEPDPNFVSFSPGDEKTYLVNFECLIPGTTEYGLEADKDGSFAKDVFETVTCVLSDGGNDDPPPIDDGDQNGTKVDYTELFPVLAPCLVHTIEESNGNVYKYGDDCTEIEYSDKWVHVDKIRGVTETVPKVEIPCQTLRTLEYQDGTIATEYVPGQCSYPYDAKIVFPSGDIIDIWNYCDRWGFYDAAGHSERGC